MITDQQIRMLPSGQRMTILLIKVGWKICDIGDGSKPFLTKTVVNNVDQANATIAKIRTTEIEPADFEALKFAGFIMESAKINTVRLYELW